MIPKRHFPKRPAQAAAISFVVLSAFVGVLMPFQEQSVRERWPWAIVYCAFLALASIGLIRFGRRAFLLIGIPFVVAIAPGTVGFVLMVRSSGADDGAGTWLQLSLYLLCALGVWASFWGLRGWLLYYRQSYDNT